MVRGPGHQRGGIGGLVALLSEHGEAIEADLQRYYGLALGDVTTGRLSWRRLRVLVAQLPPDSALARALNGPAADWAPTEYLLAHVVDLLAWSNYQRAHGKGRRPRPVARPGSAPTKRRHGRTNRSPQEAARLLAALQPKGGE